MSNKVLFRLPNTLISIKNQQLSRKTRFYNRMLLINIGANYQRMCCKYFISISRQNNKITYYYFKFKDDLSYDGWEFVDSCVVIELFGYY